MNYRNVWQGYQLSLVIPHVVLAGTASMTGHLLMI